MTDETNPCDASAIYRYYRDRDVCHDVFFIEDKEGTVVMGIYFWEEPDTEEADQAEVRTQAIVAAINLPGGWVDQNVAAQFALRGSKCIAAVWSFHDVKTVRPDLSDEQAWEVLKQVEKEYADKNRGITRNTLRRTANQLFRQTSRRRV